MVGRGTFATEPRHNKTDKVLHLMCFLVDAQALVRTGCHGRAQLPDQISAISEHSPLGEESLYRLWPIL